MKHYLIGGTHNLKTYKTYEVAQIIGIHVNTVRLYEKYELISKPERLSNGYRVFTDVHIEQFRLARAALKVEVLQNGLRNKAMDIIKITAKKEYSRAKSMADSYLQQVELEMSHAEESIDIARHVLNGIEGECISENLSLTRKETAEYLQITTDTLRNWELNGLITVKRRKNGYRVYLYEDIQRLKMIRSLRCANYSLASILRMLQALSKDSAADLRGVIDTPEEGEDIITSCDKLLTSLSEAKYNMHYVLAQIEKIETIEQLEQNE